MLDNQAITFLNSCNEGLSLESIDFLLQSSGPASLWGSPGINRLSPTISGREARVHMRQLCQVLCTVVCYKPDDYDSLQARASDIINPKSAIYASFVRNPETDFITSAATFDKIWDQLHTDLTNRDAIDLYPSRLAKADCAFNALTKKKSHKPLILARMRQYNISRRNITAINTMKCIYEIELDHDTDPAQDLKSASEPFESPAAASFNNSNSLSNRNADRNTNFNSTSKTDYSALLQHNIDIGAIAFTEKHQCRHCGVKGNDALPHDLKACCGANPCLNCGSPYHKHIATSFCNKARPEVYKLNPHHRPLLPPPPSPSTPATVLPVLNDRPSSIRSNEKPSLPESQSPVDFSAVKSNDQSNEFDLQSAALATPIVAAAAASIQPVQPVQSSTTPIKELGPPVQVPAHLDIKMPWSGQYKPGVYTSIVHTDDSDSDDDY